MRKFLVLAASFASLALLLSLHAQSPAQPETPQWQIAAGGKMSFDIASIKRHPWDPASRVYYPRSNFPLGEDDSYQSTGGLMSTEDRPVSSYLAFAYKLKPDESRFLAYPKWVDNEHFDIEARGPANATKDQMRLMMQSLLADRFKLTLHWENRRTAVYAVTLLKPGKTGPQLLPFSDPPCTDTTDRGLHPDSHGVMRICGYPGFRFLSNGECQAIARNQTMQELAPGLRSSWPGTGIDRPLIDGTRLAGNFDYFLVWAPEPQPGQPTADGPAYIEALRDQLGLKLVPATATMPFLILDHIEEPTPN